MPETKKNSDKDLKTELLDRLLNLLEAQSRDNESIEQVTKAFELAYERHANQKRKSNEPYIVHPTAVAETLIKLKCHWETICAGLLHDVLEDTETDGEEIESNFGPTVLHLVKGVTKLGKLNFHSNEEAQANNFRKMIIAIADDMRVVLVKLADRLHNMQTLEFLTEEKKKRIAKETQDIFAPLANRFGLGSIKAELEDLSFKYLNEESYQEVKELTQSKQDERESIIATTIERIKKILDENNIQGEIYGRAKHLYSIHRKVERQGNYELYDLLGVRIIVNNVKECYEALGLVHDAFRPIPGRFKDYIAMPKSNLYQSLHTTILGGEGKPIEIQIRTHEMHDVAENGIAAHWNYKEKGQSKGTDNKEGEQLAWLRQLISWHTDLTDAKEYLDTVKEDIFSQEVYILSPRGDVYMLPMDSSPVDFAYRVHTKIGDTCSGAKVNEKIVPLDYKLQNGDIVEVITSKNAHPNLDWLHFVKTNQAKHKIKSWYKKQNRELHVSIAKKLLEEGLNKDLKESSGEIDSIEKLLKSKELEEIANKLNHKTIEDLLAAIGSGDNSVAQVKGRLKSLFPEQEKKELPLPNIKTRKAPSKSGEADIPDLDGLLYHLAKCCLPVPGEDVVGAISKGRGIAIHKIGCPNVKDIDPERVIEINWGPSVSKKYPTNLNIEVFDRVGIVRDILTLVADEEVNIRDFKVKSRPSNSTAELKLIVEVSNTEELNGLSSKIKSMTDVLRVDRV